MTGFEVREIAPAGIDAINAMCVMPGSDPGEVLRESAEAHRLSAALGAKVFGAFVGGEPVGRLEAMPIEAAPLPLIGEGLWVIRCLWVLERACGMGIASSLMELGLHAAREARGVAAVTYPDWIPVTFFERFGFAEVARVGQTIVLLRAADPGARVALATVTRDTDSLSDKLKVEAVFSARCPWLVQQYRRRLSLARSLSDRVVAVERVIRTRADALLLGEEGVYVDGLPTPSGPTPLEEFEKLIRDRLVLKGLL